MSVENVGSFPEVSERMAEKALQVLDTLGVQWRGRDVKAIAGDLCDKIVPLFSNKTAEAASETSVDLTKMKAEVVQLAELLAEELEADEGSSRIFYYDPVSGAYQVLIAAQKHHKHKKRKWWVIGGIVAVVAAAIVITIATGGGAGPAAQNGAGTAIASLLATNPGKKEEDKKKDNPSAAPPPNNPPPPKPVTVVHPIPTQPPVVPYSMMPLNQLMQANPNFQPEAIRVSPQAPVVTKPQLTSAPNVPALVKHAEAAKTTTDPHPTVQRATPKQESVPVQSEEKKGFAKQTEVVKQPEAVKASTPPVSAPPAEKASLKEKIQSFLKPPPELEGKVPFGPGSEQDKVLKHIISDALHDIQERTEPLLRLGTAWMNQVNQNHDPLVQPLTYSSNEVHKKIDEVMGTNLAGRYTEEAKELRQKLGCEKTVLEMPSPTGLFKDANKVATVAKALQGVEKAVAKEEAKLVGKVASAVEKSAVEARVGAATGQVLKEEIKVGAQQKQIGEQVEKLLTKSEVIANSAQRESSALRLPSNSQVRLIAEEIKASSQVLTPVQETSLFSSAAKAYDQNLSQAAHSFSKHAGRHPEIWGKLKGSMSDWHEEALKQVQHIYIAPGEFTKVVDPKTGLTWIEKRLPDGRGIRLNQDYTFKGFVD